MSSPLPAGPYKQVNLDGERVAPWYIVPFDKRGACTGPKTRAHLVEAARSGGYTDVFLFSHGWNNDWKAASERYESFIGGMIRTRHELGIPYPEGYRPLLVGVFWPSTALVLPWEEGPDFAAADPAVREESIGAYQAEVAELAADLPAEDREEFYALAQSRSLSREEATRLAELLRTGFRQYDEADRDLGGPGGAPLEVSVEDLVTGWREASSGQRPPSQPGEFGFVDDEEAAAGPEAAFGVGFLDPRHVVRLATVLQMKDRAARVGAAGVSPLLRELARAAPGARLHLIGHSYGCIVMLSALCHPAQEADPPTVESALLLQPAVSQWCFAERVVGRDHPGGYRGALQRTRRPIFATFSKNDLPLRKVFHLAARRDRDLGQPEIAGTGLPRAPSRYAALGGYGPGGLREEELQVLTLEAPPQPYAIRRDPVPEVCALNGDRGIGGHGDISNSSTWWTLLTLLDTAPPKG